MIAESKDDEFLIEIGRKQNEKERKYCCALNKTTKNTLKKTKWLNLHAKLI